MTPFQCWRTMCWSPKQAHLLLLLRCRRRRRAPAAPRSARRAAAPAPRSRCRPGWRPTAGPAAVRVGQGAQVSIPHHTQLHGTSWGRGAGRKGARSGTCRKQGAHEERPGRRPGTHLVPHPARPVHMSSINHSACEVNPFLCVTTRSITSQPLPKSAQTQTQEPSNPFRRAPHLQVVDQHDAGGARALHALLPQPLGRKLRGEGWGGRGQVKGKPLSRCKGETWGALEWNPDTAQAQPGSWSAPARQGHRAPASQTSEPQWHTGVRRQRQGPAAAHASRSALFHHLSMVVHNLGKNR
jgi:hypothetical protein